MSHFGLGHGRRRTAFVVTGILSLGLGTLGAAAPAQGAAAEAAAQETAAFTGSITNAALSASQYSVYVHVNQETDRTFEVGDKVPMLKLPSSAVTTSGDQFTLNIDPKTLPAKYVGADGNVTVDVVAEDGKGGAGLTMATARVVSAADGGKRWADPMQSVGEDNRTRAAAAEASDGLGPVTMDPLELESTAATRKAARDAGPQCSVGAKAAAAEAGPVEVMATLVDSSKRWVTIGTTYPVGGDTATLDFTSSASTKYGIATNISGDWKAGGSKSAEAGFRFKWSKSSKNRGYKTEVLYGKYRYTSGGCGGSAIYHKWQPRYETGGTDSYTADAPNWGNCVKINDGLWQRIRKDGRDYELAGGVKIKNLIGIDLTSERAYATTHKLNYNVTGGNKKMCGNNGEPSKAGKVQERKR
ncbi:hypothetical protein [Streptomyces sp. CC219B]|uniref:hypothetical protein n=1 Tax=Streptomyces sp. CC219B TaxID=3044574 RepID=UPI0024A9592C|nr:hypothetical protein [Streptomyces sp. CC219B]